MKKETREVIEKLPLNLTDWVDEILLENSKKYMVHWDLLSFRVSYPSLYATIRESIKQATQTKVSDN